MNSFRVLLHVVHCDKKGTWYSLWILAHFKCKIVLNVYLSTLSLRKKIEEEKKSLWSIKVSESEREKGKEEGEAERRKERGEREETFIVVKD